MKRKHSEACESTETSTDGLHSTLDPDVLHEIARTLEKKSIPSLLRFRGINQTCADIGSRVLSNSSEKIVDVGAVFSNRNPFILRFYETGKRGEQLKFHNDVRQLVTLLEKLAKSYGRKDLNLANFNLESISWMPKKNNIIKRCPALLQKRIVKLMKTYFKGTTSYEYPKHFLRPSRFFSIISRQLNNITCLDLGDINATEALDLGNCVFPALSNLETFAWHKAEMWFIEALPNPHKLKNISLTLRRGQFTSESIRPLLNCQALERLYFGFRVPEHATRFDLEVLLNTYQAFWNNRNYYPAECLKISGFDPIKIESSEGSSKDFCYRAFPALTHPCFWNCPTTLFIILAKKKYFYKTLQFGQLDQSLSRLCSIDSFLQALFSFDPLVQPGYLFTNNLKLYLHAMPVVSLDYYLPQIMTALGDIFAEVSSIDLFIKCSFDATMPSSWLLDSKRPKHPNSKFLKLSKFSLHIDNFCLLDDLDIYLPDTLTHLTLSFVVPPEKKKHFLASLFKFIKHFENTNRFPDLEEFHIQIYGIRCFEAVFNHVIDVIPDLQKLSVLCMPVEQKRDSLIDLCAHAMKICKKLKVLNLCPDLVNLLMGVSEVKQQNYFSWQCDFEKFSHENKLLTERCELAVSQLPLCEGFDSYVVEPVYPDANSSLTEEIDDDASSESDSKTDDEDEVSDEEDSFIVDDDERESSEDELDILEKKLAAESDRRHQRDQKKRRRILSENESTEEENDDDVVVFRGKKRDDDEESDEEDFEDEEESNDEDRNSFLDDMAEEDHGDPEEEEDDTEEEPEDEDDDSDTGSYVRQSIEIVNSRSNKPAHKRKKIIESDSE